jgi:hypothetical protein
MSSVIDTGHPVPGTRPAGSVRPFSSTSVVTRPEGPCPGIPVVSEAMILVTDDGGGGDDLSAPVPQLTSAIDERKQ